MLRSFYKYSFSNVKIQHLLAANNSTIMLSKRNKYHYAKQTEEEKRIADSGKFKFFSSAVVERLPVITPNAPKWYTDWVLSDFEFQEKYGRNYTYEDIVAKIKNQKAEQKSKKQAKKAKKANVSDSVAINEIKLRKQIGMSPLDPGKQRQRDFILERRKTMDANPRVTIFDRKDDRQNLYRCLDKSLYLLVRKFRREENWQFPLAVWNGEETMRQTAERALNDELGPKFNSYFLGNSPEGHFVKHFDEALKDKTGFDGYKIFYYRVIMLGGNINFDPEKTSGYAWSSREQLKDYFSEEEAKLFHHMLCF